MSEDKIISLVLSRLNQEDMWFTTKADPTWEEPSDYYKLDEYGDLTEASVKKIVKEVENLVGDGAVDIDNAVEVWLQDAMVDYKIAYKNVLVTKFKDKPVVAGLEAYKNPVQLSENKIIKTENKEDIKTELLELNVSSFDELRDEVERLLAEEIIDDYQYDNYMEIISDQESSCIDYIERRSKVTNTDYEDELGIESDYVVSAIQDMVGTLEENKDIKTESKEIDAVKWMYGLNTSEAKEYIKSNPDKVKSIVDGYLNNAKKNFYEDTSIEKDKYPTPTGDIVEYKLSNSKDNPVWITGYVSTDENIYNVRGKVFMIGSEFGIDNGPISKLHIRLKDTNKLICNYDRGWDVRPDSKYKDDIKAIMKLLVDFRDKNPYEVEDYEESYKKVNESYKRRLKEENNKSANLISDMFKASDFDAESKQGQIVMRTSELFNALSDKGYDVQVNFDNGESTSAVLLGQQGGQVIITINNTDQPLRAFTSGNFEINNDNMNVLKDIQEQISAL